MKKLKIGTLFSGIGAFEQVLEILSIPHDIQFACDNGGLELETIATNEELEKIKELNSSDKLEYVESVYKKYKKKIYTEQSYLANYDLNEENFYHDVRFIGSHINKPIDILVGGSPCQSFSIVGKRGGFEDTRGTLFFEFARCVKEFQPKVFIYENVKGLINHDGGKTFETVLNTFEELGYKYYYQLMNAKDYGIPQSRTRIFVIGFKSHEINFAFPNKKELTTTMANFLEEDYLSIIQKNKKNMNFLRIKNKSPGYMPGKNFDKYCLSEKMIQYIMKEKSGNAILKPTINDLVAKTLVATMHKMHKASFDNYVNTANNRIRRLTPREALRLMGFCDSFKQVVSDVQMYKQAGNSIVVDVLMEIMQEIIKTGVFNE